jgi:hypothetical protein
MSFESPTYDDVSFEREDVVRMLEIIEEDPRMESQSGHSHAEMANLKNPTKDEIGEVLGADLDGDGEWRDSTDAGYWKKVIDSGDDIILHRTDGNGHVWGEYGPALAGTGNLLHASVEFINPDVKGYSIQDKHLEIIANNPATYLDNSIDGEEEMRINVEHDMIATLDVPTDYDEGELRSSYETAMTRIDKAQELQRVAKGSIEDFEV